MCNNPSLSDCYTDKIEYYHVITHQHYQVKLSVQIPSSGNWECGVCMGFRQHLVVQGRVKESQKNKWESTVGWAGMRPSPPPPHTHARSFSPALSAPTRCAERAVAAQWSGTGREGEEWGSGRGRRWGGVSWGRVKGGKGDCWGSTGRSVAVQSSVPVRLSLSSLPLVSVSFLLPYSLSVFG